jgi:hypothetical protein
MGALAIVSLGSVVVVMMWLSADAAGTGGAATEDY